MDGKSVFPVTGTTIFFRLKLFSKVNVLSKVPGVLLKNLIYNFNEDSGGIIHLVSSLLNSPMFRSSGRGKISGYSFDLFLSFLAMPAFFLSSFL